MPEAMDRPSFEGLVVPAARRLPSNASYLAHLAASAGNPALIRLASNENTEPPSPHVREALERAYSTANLSPPPQPPLQLALAERHALDPAQVLIGAGSTEVIDAVFRTFAHAGSRIVIPDPSWPVFQRRLQALEAEIVPVPLGRDSECFRYSADDMLAAITPETRLVVVCSPNNPTGNSMRLDGIRQIAETGTPLLVDAAYADFDAANDPTNLVRDYENVIVTRTFSKAYCLAGLRVGYAVGDARLLDYVDRFLVPGSSISSTSLLAGLAALEDEDYHRRQVERIIQERERLVASLRALGLGVYASAGNFVAVDCASRPGGPEGLAAAVLAQGVVIRPLGSLVRISIGRRDENDALVHALARVLETSDR